MVTLSPKAQDHRRRVLEHQGKIRAEQSTPESEPAAAQFKIGLIGEANTRSGVSRQKRKGQRVRRTVQLELRDL